MSPTFARNAEAVEAAYRDYRELAISRDGLKRIYVVTLTFALLMALFAAVAVAVTQSNLLADPPANLVGAIARYPLVRGMGEGYRPQVPVLILQGEADLATLQELETALARIHLDDAKAIHLHLDRLTFADVATLRRLTAFARSAKQSGYDIRTCGANPMIRKVARLLSVQEDLGLRDG